MHISVSALSYAGPKMNRMGQLPLSYGIEIFWDWGSEDYFARLLPSLMEKRTGAFSIHGPMICEDLSDPAADPGQFERLMRPFDIYHRFDSKFYLLHTNGAIPKGATARDLEYRRKLAAERIYTFRELCQREGVELVMENLGPDANGVCLFSPADFLKLFSGEPKLNCLLDIGHGLLTGMDISLVQRQLGSRIKGYHLHDNDGRGDQHLRVGQGICDWQAWRENHEHYTPQAELVFEYNDHTSPEVFIQDTGKLTG